MSSSMANGCVSALLVGEFENDRLLVHDVFDRLGWKLYEARDRRKALASLGDHPVQVVLADSDMPSANWKRLLSDLRRFAPSPQLIVTSRCADDLLWAEVLNFGGFDVLARPFETDELERVIASARRHYDVPPRARPLLTAGAA